MKSEPQRLLLDVSWTALFRVLAFVLGLWAVVTLRDVLIMLFGVFIFVAAVNPTVSRWQRHISRPLAVTLFYALLVGVLALIFSTIVPRLLDQVNNLIRVLPGMLDRVRPYLTSLSVGGSPVADQLLATAKSGLNSFSSSFLSTTLSFFGGLATVVTGAVISFYLLLEEKNARDFFHQVLPQHRFEAVYHTVSQIAERMGSWVRGQLLLMLIIGVADLVVYLLIGLPAPLPLSFWAGLCEVIPFIGPTLGMLPALIVALTSGSLLQAVLVVVIAYGLIQQLETHIIVPRVMSRAVGLSPVLVIVSLTVGVQLLGLVGALLAVPVAAIVSVVVGAWPELRKLWEAQE